MERGDIAVVAVELFLVWSVEVEVAALLSCQQNGVAVSLKASLSPSKWPCGVYPTIRIDEEFGFMTQT